MALALARSVDARISVLDHCSDKINPAFTSRFESCQADSIAVSDNRVKTGLSEKWTDGVQARRSMEPLSVLPHNGGFRIVVLRGRRVHLHLHAAEIHFGVVFQTPLAGLSTDNQFQFLPLR